MTRTCRPTRCTPLLCQQRRASATSGGIPYRVLPGVERARLGLGVPPPPISTAGTAHCSVLHEGSGGRVCQLQVLRAGAQAGAAAAQERHCVLDGIVDLRAERAGARPGERRAEAVLRAPRRGPIRHRRRNLLRRVDSARRVHGEPLRSFAAREVFGTPRWYFYVSRTSQTVCTVCSPGASRPRRRRGGCRGALLMERRRAPGRRRLKGSGTKRNWHGSAQTAAGAEPAQRDREPRRVVRFGSRRGTHAPCKTRRATRSRGCEEEEDKRTKLIAINHRTLTQLWVAEYREIRAVFWCGTFEPVRAHGKQAVFRGGAKKPHPERVSADERARAGAANRRSIHRCPDAWRRCPARRARCSRRPRT